MSEARQLLPRDERRAQLLRAAARAFADGGFAATSMEDVAVAAGVTRLIVYRHFESKEELYRAVLDEVSVALREEFVRSVGPERGGSAIEALLTVARGNPDGYRLLVFHAVREPQFEAQVMGYWQESVERVDEMLGADVREPAVRGWVVQSVMGYLLHSVLLWLENGHPADDATFVETATAGLRALHAAWTR